MKKQIVTTLLALSLGATAIQAAEFDLRNNMLKLNMQLNEIQRAMMVADKKTVKALLPGFREDVKALLGNKEALLANMPEDMKKKRHKLNLGIKASRNIDKHAAAIQEAIEKSGDKENILHRRADAQEAYAHIITECFNCHNLARDKEKIKSK